MNQMLLSLVKVRFAALFSTMFRSSKKAKKKTKMSAVGLILLFLFVFASMGFSFGTTLYMICEPLCSAGLGWLYFTVGGMIAFALMFIGSVFMTQTQIFNATDNELLLSMPVPPKYILASRMISLMAFNYLYGAIIVIPMGVVWCITQPVTFGGVVIFILLFVLMGFAALALSCVIAYLISLLTSRMRNKNIITLILSLGFLALYFVLYSRIFTYIEKLVSNGAEIAAAIKSAFIPAYWYGAAASDGNWLYLLLFALYAIVPFAVIYEALSYSFIKIATAKRGAARIKYRERRAKSEKVMSALVKREFAHFLSSAGYMMNAALGLLFIVVAAVALIVKSDILTSLTAEMPDIALMLSPMLCLVLCAMTTMNFITAPSISIEGKSFWLLRSLPVDTFTVLMSKAAMSLWLTTPPTLFASIVVCCTVKPSPMMCVIIVVAPAVFNYINAILGLLMNLRWPKLDYINETLAVKQGIPTIVTMLLLWAMVIAPALLYGFVISKFVSAEIFTLTVTVLYAVLAAVLTYVLKTKGVRQFEQI